VHSGRYIADTILSTILEVEAAVGAGAVTAVVTDNARNIKRHGSWFEKSVQALFARVVQHTA
jgi:hypothetical protein